VVGIKLVRLEIKPAERGRDGERLAVWQMDNRRSHDVCERTTRVGCSAYRGDKKVWTSTLAYYSSQCLLSLTTLIGPIVELAASSDGQWRGRWLVVTSNGLSN